MKRTKIILSKEYRVSHTEGSRFFYLHHRPCYKRRGKGRIDYWWPGRIDSPLENRTRCRSCNISPPKEIINKVLFIVNSI